ncbi:MAG: hypothetical protein KI785_08860 [Devosiaceae bacterium]|nr:hypothetical protein [Devosiaceae bacterium MH13]
MDPIRILYLDDCEIDHRLLDVYLQLDEARAYELTPCRTLEEALTAMNRRQFDALVIDNKMPPFSTFLEPYDVLRKSTGFTGPTIVVSADVSVPELKPDALPGSKMVVDKAELSTLIQDGMFGRLVS